MRGNIVEISYFASSLDSMHYQLHVVLLCPGQTWADVGYQYALSVDKITFDPFDCYNKNLQLGLDGLEY